MIRTREGVPVEVVGDCGFHGRPDGGVALLLLVRREGNPVVLPVVRASTLESDDPGELIRAVEGAPGFGLTPSTVRWLLVLDEPVYFQEPVPAWCFSPPRVCHA